MLACLQYLTGLESCRAQAVVSRGPRAKSCSPSSADVLSYSARGRDPKLWPGWIHVIASVSLEDYRVLRVCYAESL